MKKTILYMTALALTTVTVFNSCIKEIDPQSNTVTADQASAAPGAFDNFVASLTSSLNGSAKGHCLSPMSTSILKTLGFNKFTSLIQC